MNFLHSVILGWINLVVNENLVVIEIFGDKLIFGVESTW
jgi:hypothetical protein